VQRKDVARLIGQQAAAAGETRFGRCQRPLHRCNSPAARRFVPTAHRN